MKILKVIAIATLIYCCRSAFSMEEEQQPHVTFSKTKHAKKNKRWIQPGQDTTTTSELYAASDSAHREGSDKRPHGQQGAYERARALSQEEENLYVTPEMRREREQQLRQHYIQQQEQRNMLSEQDWN
jgi:hypothetical protein